MISAYFHSIYNRKSEEGFNSANLVLRHVDAFCGLCRKDEERIKFEEKGGKKMKDILGSKILSKNQSVYRTHVPYANKVTVLLLIQRM